MYNFKGLLELFQILIEYNQPLSMTYSTADIAWEGISALSAVADKVRPILDEPLFQQVEAQVNMLQPFSYF